MASKMDIDQVENRKWMSVTKKDHLWLLENLLTFTGVNIALIIFLLVYDALDWGTTAVISGIWALIAMVVLYLHWEYSKHEKNVCIYVDNNNKCIFYSNSEKKMVIQFENVVDITLYMTYPMYVKTSYALPYSWYYFGEIKTKNDECIIVTTLLIPDLEEELSKISHIKIKKEISLFTSINFTI